MRKIYFFVVLFFCISSSLFAQISLTGGAYTQDFNTLSNTAGSTTNNLTITGWLMTETGGGARDNEQYAVDPGSSNTGDTYSYGTAGSTDRALGGLRSGTLVPLFGASFTNNTGSTITSLNISYTGEEWRLGTAARTDQINFEYSTNATDLTTGTWTGVSALNFITPVTATVGAKDGNAAANRTVISTVITGLSIPNGATFIIRWTDTDATGADDGLAIDDFSITPNTGAATPNLSINDVSLVEGNAGTTTFAFTVSLSAPAGAGGVTFDIATADGTATIANNDYASNSLTGQTIAAGNSTYTFNVTVNGDPTVEPNETFFVNVTNVTGATVADGQGQGTILNDDVTLTPIHSIQGNGNASPIIAAVVTTSGIVTGRRSNGFFLQEPDATVDADPLTSEGIFVFTSAAPPASAAVGNFVQVAGTVAEFIPTADPNSPSQTELVSPTVLLISSGNPLPTAVALTTANTNPAGTPYQLEPFEGMRVSIASFTVVAPTGGNLTEANATSASNGLFYGVITGINRPFREPGIDVLDPLPSGAPVTVTRFDGNPEIIGVGSNSLGAPAIDVTTGAVLTNLVGPLDYRSRFYTVDIEPATPPTVSNNGLTFTAVPAQLSNELTVGSFNLERFYNDVNDAGGDAVLTTTAYNNRLNKASLAIRNVLKTPDVLGIIEMEDLTTLQALAAKINSDAVAAGDPNPNYNAFLIEGNDVGLIDVGFLVKPGRVTVNSVTQYGLTTTYTNPNNGLPELLNDRPPLVLNGTFTGATCATNNNFMVIVNHLRSLNGVDDPVDGNRVRTKRQQQAEFLANLIQSFQAADPTAQIISVGDYNAFEFNDGYVDMIGTIKGVPTPASQVTLASPDLVNPNLVDLVDTHIPSQKYSYSFSGSAQTLDHILVNANMNARLSRFAIARVDADFPEVFRNDANRPERISDHDAPVAYFTFPVSTPSITCPAPVTVSCASAVPAPNTALVTATDVCGTPTVTHQGDVISNQTCANRYTITRTYRATNAAGNFAECTQIITVNDVTAPTITCPAPVTVSCASAVPAVNIGSVTASDNCGGGVTVTWQGDVISAQTCANRYTITRTYRATDVCGNFAQCTQIITVNDVTPPTVTCPANITVSTAAGVCSAVVTFTPTATDNCGGAVTITSVPASGSTFPVGTTTVTTTATDACGNTATCTFTVTVQDNQAPTIVCPANITVNNDPGICGAVVNYPFPTVSDNCALPGGTAVALTQSTNNTTITPIQIGCQYFGGQTAENSWWRAYDLAPRNLPAGLTIKSVRMGVERITTATTVPVTVRIYTSAGAFPGGTRTLRATQTVNLASQTNTIVTVPFTTPATVAPNAIVVVEVFVPDQLASNSAFFLGSNALGQSAPSYITAPACGINAPTDLTDIGFPDDHIILDLNGEYYINAPTLVQTAGLPRGATFPVGVTTNTYRATDAAGNQSTCSFTVTVNDAQAPTFTTCPAGVIRNTDAGQCYATYTPVQPTFADNCAVTALTWVMTGATTGSSPATGINFVPSTQFQTTGTTGTGLTTITYTIKDAAGNTTTCVTTVRVNDAAIPVITVPPATKFVCVGSDAVFSVTASAGTGNPLTYQWQQWNGSAWANIAGATTNTLTIPTVSFAQNTNTYRVVLTGRCSVVISDVATLYVNPLPTVTLVTSIPPSLTPSQSLNITANVSPAGGSFVWRKDGSVIGATGSSLTGLTVDDIGTYRVTYTDPNGCVNTSADVVVTGQASDNLWVYPNPNNGRFQVRFYNTPGENATVRVFDSKGAKVFEKTVATGINYTRIDVELNKPVASEMYIVELVNSSGQRIGTKKIIVQ